MQKPILLSILSIIILSVFAHSSAKTQTIFRIDSSLNVQSNNLIETDVDGDGLLDIAGINSTTVVWYKNLGDSIATLPTKFLTLSYIGNCGLRQE